MRPVWIMAFGRPEACVLRRLPRWKAKHGPALTASEIDALREALDDEYRAWATYDQVIADFGDVRPFSNIRNTQ